MLTSIPMISVPLSSLVVNEQWNSRVALDGEATHKTAQSIDELARLMKEQGQLSPILVLPLSPKHGTDGKFRVIAGFRRVAAAKSLGWVTINAIIPEIKDESQAVLINLSENLARKDLSTFEIARGVSALKNEGLTGDQIAERLGFSSRSYVNNLANAYKSCHPKILEAWAKGEGCITTDNLNRLAQLPSDAQLIELDKLRGVSPKSSSGDSGEKTEESEGDKNKKAKPHSRKYADLEAAYNACKGWKGDKTVKSLMISVFEYALCKANAIKAIDFDLDAIKEASDAVKRAEKAAKMEEAAKLIREGKYPKKGKKDNRKAHPRRQVPQEG